MKNFSLIIFTVFMGAALHGMNYGDARMAPGSPYIAPDNTYQQLNGRSGVVPVVEHDGDCECTEKDIEKFLCEWLFDPACCFCRERERHSAGYKCGMVALKALTFPVCLIGACFSCCWYTRVREDEE